MRQRPAGAPSAARPRQDGAGHTDDGGRCSNWWRAIPLKASDQRQTHFSRLTIELVGAGSGSPGGDRGAEARGTAGQRHDPQFAVCRHRRRRHPRRRCRATGGDLLHRHRLPPRAAQGRHLLASSTRRSRPTASRHLERRGGRVLAAEFVNAGRRTRPSGSSTATAGAATSTSTARASARAFLASPMEFSRVTSGFAMRFHPILKTWRAAPGRRLRRPHGHARCEPSATGWSSSPAGRTAMATSCRSSTATSDPPSTRT
jgi:hypothetical protein